jgi:hypothetical protein
MPTSSLQNFVQSLTSTESTYREDFDIPSLLNLQGEEREEAEELLLNRLTGSPDRRVPRALGYMKSLKALPELEYGVVMHMDAAVMRAEVVLAIWAISQDPRVPGWLQEILAKGNEAFGRNIAGYSLRDFPGKASEAALWEAIKTETSQLVRINATDSLFKLLQVPRWGKGAKLGHMRSWLSSDLKSLRGRGIKQLETLLADISADKALDSWLERPESRSPEMKALLKALRAEPSVIPEYPETEINKLTELEKRHAVFVLLAAIERGDPRAPEALSWLNASDFADVLEERLSDEGPLGLALATTLHHWGQPSGKTRLQAIANSDSPLSGTARNRLAQSE